MASAIVSNAKELASAIMRLSDGGTIYLRPGSYGSLHLSDLDPSSKITLVSSVPSSAHFDSIVVERSEDLNFLGVDVGGSSRKASPGQAAIVVGGSENIAFTSINVHGNGDGDPRNDPIGLQVRRSSGIAITNSDFHELHKGITVSFASQIDIRGNTLKNMGEDGMDFAQVEHARISANEISNFSKILPGMHPDAIQFMTAGTTKSSEDITISDNVILQGTGKDIQGIFLGNEVNIPYKNVNISNNFVHTQQFHGISVGRADGVSVLNNTVLSSEGGSAYSWIMMNNVFGATVSNNISEAYINRNSHGLHATGNWDLGMRPELWDLFPAAILPNPKTEAWSIPSAGYQLTPYGAKSGVTVGDGAPATSEPGPTHAPPPPPPSALPILSPSSASSAHHGEAVLASSIGFSAGDLGAPHFSGLGLTPDRGAFWHLMSNSHWNFA